jgi:SapC protein
MEGINGAGAEAPQTRLPVFYRRPRPLDAVHDCGWSLLPTPDVRYARATNSVLLGAAEFAPAMRSYPIVFTSTEPRVAVAVLGLEGDENLSSTKMASGGRATTSRPMFAATRLFSWSNLTRTNSRFVLMRHRAC